MKLTIGGYDLLCRSTLLLCRPVWVALAGVLVISVPARCAPANDEAYIVTPPGFTKPGVVKTALGETTGRLRMIIRDCATGRPTACRLNIVGPDGNFYQPTPNPLTPYSLTGQWPQTGKGNREGKAPIRYLGRFFYCTGEVELAVPAGSVRVEVWKGFEHQPITKNIEVIAGETKHASIELKRTVPMAAHGYYSGDSHLHFPRQTAADDQVILDLLEAEDIHFGSILAYNEPAGPYTGAMESMAAPQLHGLGKASTLRRGSTWITSGQEYRSTAYGHLNLYWRDALVLKGEKVNANNWPLYGQLARETKRLGGFAIYAHGGYSQAIYSDFVQKNVDAVELLQFGVYRGIALDDWYRILNIGYRFPCIGASDYPACRKLGDCQTYVYLTQEPVFSVWLQGVREGRSFVTTGPLLLLEVDGEPPGVIIRKTGTRPQRVHVRVRMRSEVAPVQNISLIVGGRVVLEHEVPPGSARGQWIELERDLQLSESSWIAARASGTAHSGAPDAEAHTNPVYVHLDGRAPYDRDSLDHLVVQIDQQMAIHRKRAFAEKARVLDDFQKSRDILLRIRNVGGLSTAGVPDDWINDTTVAAVDPSQRSHTDEELTRFLQPLSANNPRVGDALLSIARTDAANRWIRAAVLSSCLATAHRLIVDLWTDGIAPIPTAQADLLEQLAEVVGARNRTADIDRVLDCLALDLHEASRIKLRDQLVLGLARGLRRSGGQFPVDQLPARAGTAFVAHLIQQARTRALDSRLPEPARVEAINTLSLLTPAESRVQLVGLLEPRQPLTVQIAVVRTLAEVHSVEVAAILLPRLRTFEPSVRTAAVRTLLTRASSTKALLRAISRENPSTGIAPALIDLADRTPLMKHSDAEIARLAQVLFAQEAPRPRAQVINEYVSALRVDGNAARGIRVFERECMACHRVGDRGFDLGPDLTGSPSRDPATLLANILDPNANVAPNSVQYLVIDQNGRTYAGIIASETATSLTLRRGGGGQDTILRAQIAEMISTGLSLMPEGLEKTISKPEMADLVSFLRASHRGGDGEAPGARQSQSLDIGTLPGLIEPDN